MKKKKSTRIEMKMIIGSNKKTAVTFELNMYGSEKKRIPFQQILSKIIV